MQARISDWGPETSLETSIGYGRPSPYSVVRAPRVSLVPRVANSRVNGLLTEVIRTSPRRRGFMSVVFAPSHGIRILMACELPFQSQSKTERRMHTSPRSNSSLKETSIVPNIKRRQRQGESRTLADIRGVILMRTCNEPEALLLIRFLSPCMDCAILAEINSSAQSSKC